MSGPAVAGPRDWLSELIVPITIFKNFAAATKRELRLSIPKIKELILSSNAPSKDKLRWLKTALFGENRSPKGSLRHDANIETIYGLEADYDDEKITFDQAREILTKAGVLSILYTSPSHTEDTPRWRVLAFFSEGYPPEKRDMLFGRLNGLFRAVFSIESWTLSQAYYFGPVNRNPSHRVEIIDGEPIDLMDHLTIGWMGRPGFKPRVVRPEGDGAIPHPNAMRYGPLDEAAVINDLITGKSMHGPLVRLAGAWARAGKPYMEARQELIDHFDAADDEVKAGARWQERRGDLDRCLEDIYGKEARKRDDQERKQGRDERPEPPPHEEDPNVAAVYQALRDSLAKNENGAVFGTHANMALILKGDPLLRGIARRNEFTNSISITRPMPGLAAAHPTLPGPYPREMMEDDPIALLGYVQKVWCRAFRRQTVTEALMLEAQAARFHPVRDWLGTLKWDGVARLDGWLHAVFDCRQDDYHKAVAKSVLIAAVRRVRRPGCKFDTILILEGPQGILKSTALQVLFGAEWTMDDLHHDLGNKDAPISMAGKWCIELAEIGHVLRTGSETMKAFLSRGTDHFRPPFAAVARDVPRQSIFIGSTNNDDYLTDASGNRRYWPIKCLVGPGYERQAADLEWLRANRDQLWAEAAHREAAGEVIWLVDDSVTHRATIEQAARMSGDPWRERVLQYAEMAVGPVQIPHILTSELHVEIANQTKPMEMRISGILKAEGWIRKQRRSQTHGGRPVRLWYRNEQAAREDSGEAGD